MFHGIEDAFLLETYIAGLWGYAAGRVDGGVDGLPDGWLAMLFPAKRMSTALAGKCILIGKLFNQPLQCLN
ncbi:hypothetical protein [Dictyobacter aurantiacus]|uniref:Uncharacterized protein n=1 Tax=Dictyobacter aurantiacus TaxID=1936993 RepID=A0A401ZQS4_9CHLR|nr:hypothetical protein [Dictyobacter aurantiacus]GCE09225.1 hypothetical protein KDAU_65540 [Dictyobacter aurantiacus]